MNILYCLTNRNGYASPAFPVGAQHTPRQETSNTRALREFFNLHETTSDLYVVLALNLLRAQPDLLVGIDCDDSTYKPELWAPAMPQIAGASLIPRHGVPACLVRMANEWPFTTEMRLVNPLTAARFEIGNKSWSVATLRHGTQLRVEWPVESGIAGDLLAQNWDATNEVIFHHTPVRFPFHIVVPALRSFSPALALLREHGLLSDFTYADSPRSVALVLAALARSTQNLA